MPSEISASIWASAAVLITAGAVPARAQAFADIKGALVGVEAVTPEGLKAVFKDWNYSGEALARQLQTFRQHGVHVLGSFIFGLPTDKPAKIDLHGVFANGQKVKDYYSGKTAVVKGGGVTFGTRNATVLIGQE